MGKILCKASGGVLPVIKEFYANMEEKVEDKLSVTGRWIEISSIVINNQFNALNHEEDDYSTLMEGIESTERVETLCQKGKETIWTSGKNNQNLNFHGCAL